MIYRSCLSFLIFLTLWCKAGAQELPLTHFTSDSEINALPSALVTSVYQDRQGFIWFAVFTSGLVRYDGSNMHLFEKSDGLRDLGVWQMLEDSRGYLWVSSGGGLVVSEKPLHHYIGSDEVRFTPLFKGTLLARNAVNTNQQLAVDNTGRIWLGTADKGIIRYYIDEEGGITSDTLSTAIGEEANLPVTSMEDSEDGEFIVGLEGGILVKYQNDVPVVLYGLKEGDLRENFYSLYVDENDDVWAYRQNGEILRFKKKKGVPIIVDNALPSNIAAIAPLRDGTLLIGNGESGIIRIEKETAEISHTYSRSNGLLNNNVYDILEDREGNVWIANSGGVSKLKYNFNAFENFTARSIGGEKPGLPAGKVTSVLTSGKSSSPCEFWVGTEGGGVACFNEYGSSKFITQADGLAGDWVNGITRDKSGRIWFATTRGVSAIVFSKDLLPAEAYHIREIDIFGTKAFLFSIYNSPPSIAAENLQLKDVENQTFLESLWFLGRKNLCVVVDGKTFKLSPEQGLPESLYISASLDDEGYLWIGTEDRGLFRSRNVFSLQDLTRLSKAGGEEEFEQVWALEKGAPTNKIEKLLWHKNRLWIGTQFGLFKMDPSNYKILNQFNSSKGLPADNAVSFDISPKTGNLWVGTNNGLAEVDPEDGKVLKVVNRQNGLINNEVWLYGSVKIDEEGKVYYGTSNGLSIYHPEKDLPNLVPPILQLVSSTISYKSDSRNEVVIEYAALSFSNVSGVRYRTRLLGYDNNWSPPTSVKSLRYTNLPAYLWPKEYTLEVMAQNESGIMAVEPLRYKFTVQPVWWLQWWAFLIYVFFIGILIFGVDRVQRRRVIKRERHNAKLREAELQAETATARSNAAESQALALRAENERKALELEKVRELEKAYNELKITQNQLIQAEKMASLGRLATGVAHEIKNPLNFINNFAELSVDLVDELEIARKNGDEEEIVILLQDLKQNTSKIEQHGKKADAIVKSLMQHTRGGKSVFEVFRVNDLVSKYAEVAFQNKQNQYQKVRPFIKKSFDPLAGKIKVVGQEIGQVLVNLIGNSLDAVHSMRNFLGEEYEAVISLATKKTGNFVEIFIADNGPGVPEEIRERIFEPFFTTKPTGEGTGLGLSLSYNIITQGHNGSLRLLDQKPGEGAVFVITLPVYQDHIQKKVLVKK